MGFWTRGKIAVAVGLAYVVPTLTYTAAFYLPTARSVVHGQQEIARVAALRSEGKEPSVDDERRIHEYRSMIEEWKYHVRHFTLAGVPLYEASTPVRVPLERIFLDEPPQFHHTPNDVVKDRGVDESEYQISSVVR